MADINLASEEVAVSQLLQAVEGMHDCKAVLDHAEHVQEKFQGQTVWEGIVHVFTLIDHPQARSCYCWSESVAEADRRQF